MKGSSLVLFVGLLFSCSRTNELCHCIEESEALNNLSNELLYLDSIPKEKQEELFALRKRIDSLCSPFQEIGTEELYKMRNECIDEELLKVE